MTIVACSYPFVVGVNTHARKHVFAIIAVPSGERIDSRDFPATGVGINRAIAWVARRTEADLATLWVIEGAASYGAVLAGAVAAAGYQVAEAARMDALPRRWVGKSDPRTRTGSLLPSLPWKRTSYTDNGSFVKQRERPLDGAGWRSARRRDHQPDWAVTWVLAA